MAATAKKKYTVADVYSEADKMLKEEMQTIKNRPLTQSEEVKMTQLSKLISKMVLKEMKVL
ncbi:MAG: hypothetical protein PHH60_03805 [Candidatus Margulisbacteria bacterium]|nr:hypothetical protein [Candidatus Margulisiibacteriota bacterium]